jgi:hypothetical protein
MAMGKEFFLDLLFNSTFEYFKNTICKPEALQVSVRSSRSSRWLSTLTRDWEKNETKHTNTRRQAMET